MVPLSRGGSDELDNLQLLCREHNSGKGDSC
jgi:5-methylcytosine-specific restriction endonuclease McrA